MERYCLGLDVIMDTRSRFEKTAVPTPIARTARVTVTEDSNMRTANVISAGVLLLLLGAFTPTFAQEQHGQDAKPEKQEQQAKPEKQQQETKPEKQEQQQQHQQTKGQQKQQQQQAKSANQNEQRQAKGQQEQQQRQRQQQAKSANQNEQRQAKGQQEQQQRQRQQQAKSANQNEQRQAETQEEQRHRQVRTQQNEEKSQRGHAEGQWARNGQRDSRGHEYSESRFGREHHARFEENGGRFYDGRREFSYGGYWFYAGSYPAWFYQQDVYFVMGADGLWYAVSYGDPSLMFQVNID
jgi:hypothetical protein